MPRPRKWRRVCKFPATTNFSPSNLRNNNIVNMTVDEYETIRLIDWEGLTQEQCAEQLGVARTTAQSIYSSARKKLANCIVEGSQLIIEGGEYQVCERGANTGGCCCCKKYGRKCPKEKPTNAG